MGEDGFDEFSSVTSGVKDGDSFGVDGDRQGHSVGFGGGVVEKHAGSGGGEVGHVEAWEEEGRWEVGKVGPNMLLDVGFGVEVFDVRVTALGDWKKC